jgi:hypothetical protein
MSLCVEILEIRVDDDEPYEPYEPYDALRCLTMPYDALRCLTMPYDAFSSRAIRTCMLTQIINSLVL